MKSIIGLLGSCVMVGLIAIVLTIRAPFQFIAWVLGLLLEVLAALCMWLERL